MATPSTPQVFAYSELSREEIISLQKLSSGEAEPHQQQLALKAIVNKLCRAQDLLYIPESFSDTAFLNGRAFVGQKILMHLGIAIGKLDLINQQTEDSHHARSGTKPIRSNRPKPG